MWQGYFVEMVILGVGLCIVTLRGAGVRPAVQGRRARRQRDRLPLPALGLARRGVLGHVDRQLENAIYLVAMLKIVISFTWMIVISLNTTMGVAWHRFTAWLQHLVQARARPAAPPSARSSR